MRKITLFLCLLFFASIIKSQTYYPLVNSTAIWHEQEVHCSGWPCSMFYVNYYFPTNLEVTINQKQYRILESYEGDYFFIREDSSKKVFLYQTPNMQFNTDTSEILLYDFNLQPGDTFKINRFNGQLKSIVDSIEMLNIGGQLRKRFYINRLGYGPNLTWIEGIGSSFGLFGNYYIPFEGWHSLLCYNDSLINYISPEYNDCIGYNPLNINEKADNFIIKIYPNPASDYIYIENIKEKARIEIYNMSGIIQLTADANGDSNINIRNLPDGLYLIKIQTDSNIAIKKLLKQ